MSPAAQYSKRMIAFIDILGFRELLKDSDNLNLLVEQLKKMKEIFSTPSNEFERKLKYEIIQVSDSIVVSVDVADVFDISLLIQRLGDHVRDSFIDFGIVVRGAITYGDFYAREGILVSPAVAKAYELEQKTKFPRIAVSEEVMKLIVNHSDWFEGFIKTDDIDGTKYLDYLRMAAFLDKKWNPKTGWPEFDVEKRYMRFARHKELITSNLKKFRDIPEILEKYIWLGNYHNNFISALGDDQIATCGIDENILDRRFQRERN